MAGPDVLMSYLGIPHSGGGQTNILAAGVYQGRRPPSGETIGHGRVGELDGIEHVMFGIRILAPTIAHDQNERRIACRRRCHESLGYRIPDM